MSGETAVTQQAQGSENLIANVNVYWRVSALGLAAVAILGILLTAIGGNFAYIPNQEFMESVLVFDWTHNVVHVALFAIAAAFGFGNVSRNASRNAAKVVGVTYLALGVLGFVPAVNELLQDTLLLGLEAGENVLHLLLGSWGAYAGFTGSS